MRVPHLTHRSGSGSIASFTIRALAALLLAAATLASCARQAVRPVLQPLPTWISPRISGVPFPSVQAPGSDTVGLASDGQRLWASDRSGGIFVLKKEWRVLPEAKGIRPGPIAWDGNHLWVVNEDERVIVALDGNSGAPLRSIDIPRSAIHQPPTAVGLAWDGTSLWLLTACGLCSSFYRLETGKGAELQSFAPFCDARGLAFDPPHLVNLSYNGPKGQGRIFFRQVDADPRSVIGNLSISSVQVPDLSTEPTALVVHGKRLLVALRGHNELIPLVIGKQLYPPLPPPIKDPDLRVR